MTVPDGPFDRWYIPPEPLRFAIADERFTNRTFEEDLADSIRPAWIPFIGMAAWSVLMISDCSERLTLGTLAALYLMTPVAFIATLLFGTIALENNVAERPTRESDDLDNDPEKR